MANSSRPDKKIEIVFVAMCNCFCLANMLLSPYRPIDCGYTVINIPLVSELLRPFVQINSLPYNVFVEYLLYGDRHFTNHVNKSILERTLGFIHETGRFD